jgi:predicted nucleic acid-binding protein
MTLDDALRGVRLLAIDTAPLIYFIERDTQRVDVMRSIVQRIARGELEGVTSVITLTEVLSRPLELGEDEIATRYRAVLHGGDHFRMVSIDADVAEQAAILRARYRLATPDALQVAASLSAASDAFLTNDRELLRVDELRVLVLDDLQLETEELNAPDAP